MPCDEILEFWASSFGCMRVVRSGVKFHQRNYQGLVNVFFILNDPLLTSELITHVLAVSSASTNKHEM